LTCGDRGRGLADNLDLDLGSGKRHPCRSACHLQGGAHHPDFQCCRVWRIADQGVGKTQGVDVERARNRYAERLGAETAHVLDRGRQSRVVDNEPRRHSRNSLVAANPPVRRRASI